MAAAKPRSRLNPTFVSAVGKSQIANSELARRAGFAQPQQFSSLLHAQLVLPSPRTVVRLRMVAELVGFVGELFIEEFPPHSRDAFDAASLPEAGR